MSEEILKALMELFALISKQDEGTSIEERAYVEHFLKVQLNQQSVQTYLQLFDGFAGLSIDLKEGIQKKKKRSRISMLDSVKTIRVCEKINSTLVHKQKIIVVVRLFELLISQKALTEQKLELLHAVADAFRLSNEMVEKIQSYIQNIDNNIISGKDFLFITSEYLEEQQRDLSSKILKHSGIEGVISMLRAEDDLFFIKHVGPGKDTFLNGLPIVNGQVYVFSSGSTLKFPKGKPLYYSDIVASIISRKLHFNLSFEAKDITYHFKNGNTGLQDISISENQGKLLGIMGASGAGKTTLLNALMGASNLSKGSVKINGLDVSANKDELQGVIGYVPQDDLLMEDLTVFQNLYYAAKLCFADKTPEEIENLVHKTLNSLGLFEIKDLKVGHPLNKTISGGQRKRLNIALELIREPAVLFLDEPTSGLSSRDSENVIDLLRELALKGKLIFVVIHQPSSDIYKMFDKVVILDVGGYQIYYGNPVEAISYFKNLDQQIDSEIAECPNCGNVNPEIIFNIIEAKVVDEYGNFTDKRKVSPKQWRIYYEEYMNLSPVARSKDKIPRLLNLPQPLVQFKIFTKRDFLSKLSNLQYVFINVLEAPILAFFLSFIIRYIRDPNSGAYVFRENDNIPSYIFMGVIVSLFIGLTVSAEEIFRDRKILKRESLLNLSRHSYLMSKLAILFTLSAVQALLFVIIGNSILEIKEMYLSYWLVFFSIFCLSNVIGLNISSAFNSAVTIYILIPLLIIPQMILGGAMFPFEKINNLLGGGYKTPVVSQFMPSKWAYEALMVCQFKHGEWGKTFYDLEQKISSADYKSNYLLPELDKRLEFCKRNLYNKKDSMYQQVVQNLVLINNELKTEKLLNSSIVSDDIPSVDYSNVSTQLLSDIKLQFDLLASHYHELENKWTTKKEKFIESEQQTPERKQAFIHFRNTYFNESVSDIVRKSFAKMVFVEQGSDLVKVIDPIYTFPDPLKKHQFAYPLFTPEKYIFGIKLDAFWYNLIVIWFYTLILYIFLYYELLRKILGIFSKN